MHIKPTLLPPLLRRSQYFFLFAFLYHSSQTYIRWLQRENHSATDLLSFYSIPSVFSSSFLYSTFFHLSIYFSWRGGAGGSCALTVNAVSKCAIDCVCVFVFTNRCSLLRFFVWVCVCVCVWLLSIGVCVCATWTENSKTGDEMKHLLNNMNGAHKTCQWKLKAQRKEEQKK